MRFYDYITLYEEYLSMPFPWAVSGNAPSAFGTGIRNEIREHLDVRLEKAGFKRPGPGSNPRFAQAVTRLLPFSFLNALHSLRVNKDDYPSTLREYYTYLLAVVYQFDQQALSSKPFSDKKMNFEESLKHLLLEPIELFGPQYNLEEMSEREGDVRVNLGADTKILPVETFKRWLWGHIYKIQGESALFAADRPAFNVYPAMARAILRGSSDNFFQKCTTDSIRSLFSKEKSLMLQFPKYTLPPSAVSYDISTKELWPKDRQEEAAVESPQAWMHNYLRSILDEVTEEPNELEFHNGRVIAFSEDGKNPLVLGNILMSYGLASSCDDNIASWENLMKSKEQRFLYPKKVFEFTESPADGQPMMIIQATLYDKGSFEAGTSPDPKQKAGMLAFVESRVRHELVIVMPLLPGQTISQYLDQILANQATHPQAQQIVKTVVHLALSNLFLVAARNENALPPDVGNLPTEDYQNHVNRAVAHGDLAKITPENLQRYADQTSQEIYRSRLFRTPTSWSKDVASLTVIDILEDRRQNDPKFICDICTSNRPDHFLSPAAMLRAATAGFNPYKLHLVRDSYKHPQHMDLFFQKWMEDRVKIDVTGWGLCERCYTASEPYLSAADRQYPTPPTANIQRLIGSVATNSELFLDVPTAPWRTLFPGGQPKPIQRIPDSFRECPKGNRCEDSMAAWKKCCGSIYRAVEFQIVPRDSDAPAHSQAAGYLEIRAQKKLSAKTTMGPMVVAPIPKLYNIGERLEYRLRAMQDKLLSLRRKAEKTGVSFDQLLEDEYYNAKNQDTLTFLEEAVSPVAGNMQIHWISQRSKWLEGNNFQVPSARHAKQRLLERLGREQPELGVPQNWTGSGPACGFTYANYPCVEWQETGEICDHLPELRFTTPHTVKTSRRQVPQRLQRAKQRAQKRQRVRRTAERVRGKIKHTYPESPPQPQAYDDVPLETQEAWKIVGELLSQLPAGQASHIADILEGRLPSAQLIRIRETLRRDTRMAEELKTEYNYHCQVCNLRLTKPDGSGYAEGAHIIPFSALSAANRADLDIKPNILVLCPNHHKQFDLGIMTIVPFKEESVETVIQGRTTLELLKTTYVFLAQFLDSSDPNDGRQLIVRPDHHINPHYVVLRQGQFNELVDLLQGRLSRYRRYEKYPPHEMRRKRK